MLRADLALVVEVAMPKETETKAPTFKINLRLNEDLRRRIEAVAKDQERSTQGEIVYRLRKSLEHSPDEAKAS
jgi:hypothetical protein